MGENSLRLIFTVTGPSCSGKTTLVRKLLETGHFTEIVSTTSRSPRAGEKHGVDYYFKDVKECEILAEEGCFAEHIHFKDNHYGIEHVEIERALHTGKMPIVIVEPNGLKQLRSEYRIHAIYVDGLIEDLYTRFLTRFRENPAADTKYEAKRLISIQKEHRSWWQDSPYSQTIPAFNSETEDCVLNQIVDKLKLLEKENDQD